MGHAQRIPADEDFEDIVEDLEDMDPAEREEIESTIEQAQSAYERGDHSQFITSGESIRCLRATR